MKEIKVFDDQLTVHISDEDWDYLCNYKFFTKQPSPNEFEDEFIVGTCVYPSEKHTWKEADKKLAQYVNELRIISGVDK